MAYFNHAYKKMFIATKETVAGSTPGQPGGNAAVTNGILMTEGINVYDLKSTAAAEGYQLGPGVLGLFDAKTNQSILGANIAGPFYLGGAAIKLNDKQGPFHGGYQQANISKEINPKYMRKVWKVEGQAASPAVLEIGQTQGNTGAGAVLTIDTLVGGSGYSSGTGIATSASAAGQDATVDITAVDGTIDTVSFLAQIDASRTPGTYSGVSGTSDGAGTGATFDITVDGSGNVTAVTVVAIGSGYVGGDTETITIADANLGGGGAADVTFTVTTIVDGVITAAVLNAGGTGYVVDETLTIAGGTGGSVDVATVDSDLSDNDCVSEFLCGETYYLRVDVKGTPALRFANHNLYRNLDASGGCCENPASPVAIDPVEIYKQWAEQIVEDPYLKDFIRPFVVVDGQSYAPTAAIAIEEGLDAAEIFANIPTTSTTAGLILKGAYVDTEFGNCTFQTSDYYNIEPVQIYASEVDLNGDPCSFAGVCVVTQCLGKQVEGIGESKVRELILSEAYLQNFVATDQRIREITQGTEAYSVLDRGTIYSSMFILHSVPRYNNPSGVFDNDQYLLEVVGSAGMLTTLGAQLQEVINNFDSAPEIEDLTGQGVCSYTLPTNP